MISSRLVRLTWVMFFDSDRPRTWKWWCAFLPRPRQSSHSIEVIGTLKSNVFSSSVSMDDSRDQEILTKEFRLFAIDLKTFEIDGGRTSWRRMLSRHRQFSCTNDHHALVYLRANIVVEENDRSDYLLRKSVLVARQSLLLEWWVSVATLDCTNNETFPYFFRIG